MKLKHIIPAIAIIGLLSAAPADAQFTKDWKNWYGNFHGGWSLAQSDFSDVVKDGWTLGGGATYFPDDWLFGISLGLDYSDHDIKREVLDAFESSGGDVSIWALTTGLTWSPRLEGSLGFYINGGVGAYRLEGRLTEPGVVCGPICPPWSWWCYPGCAPGTIVTDRISTTKFGYNLAVGLTFQVGMGSNIYVQAQYDRVETDVSTDYVPLVVGYRW